MSDPNTPHDPIDKAYAEAEAALRDDAERAARRARVLAAVARANEPEVEAEPIVSSLPPPRKGAWRPAPWLMAAGVVGVTVLVTLRVTPPAVVRPPELPSQAEAPSPQPPAAPPAERPGSTPVPIAPAAAPPASPRSRTEASADVVPPPPLPIPPVEKRVDQPDPFPAAAMAPPPPLAIPPMERRVEAPAPPPPLPIPAAPVERRVAQPAPPVIGEAMARDSRAASQVVVTGSSVRGVAPGAPDEAARLRAAAAAGRLDEMTALLGAGVAVDAPDGAGETALMKAVRTGQIAAIALLRRHGADLDRRNRAGVSAKEMAAASGDAAVRRAMGVAP